MNRATAGLASVLVAVAGLLVAAPHAATAAVVGQPLLQAAPRLPIGSVADGAVPSGSELRLTVLVPPTDPAGLAALASSVSTPGDGEWHRYLSEANFAEQFGASPAQIGAVAAEERAAGLTVVGEAADHLSLSVEGSAARVEAAFGVRLERSRIGSRIVFANQGAAALPAGASAVLGLDDLAQAEPAGADEAHPGLATAHQQDESCPTAQDEQAYLPSQVAGAYGLSDLYSDGLSGAGQTVASFELADYADDDIVAYTQCFGGEDGNVSRVLIDGGAAVGVGTSEATADIEDLLGLAPNLHVLVYEAPDSAQGIYDNYSAIVSQDRAAVASTSWGQCEEMLPSGMAQAEDYLFQEAAVQGQTVVAASGDSGSEDCYEEGFDNDPELAVDDPSSQPYVTGVGGTSLTSVSPRTESAWNSGGGAGGGGISHTWDMPSYQRVVVDSESSGQPCGASGGWCREVPDVSASADTNHGYYLYCEAGDCAGAGWAPVGGTSLAAPVWAALVALSDQGCAAGPAGFLNPTLYADAYGGAVNDVVGGNNDLLGRYNLYPAVTGYDMATGLGTPNAAALAADLCAGTGLADEADALEGYRMVASDGGIFDYGAAGFYGSTGAERLNKPIVGMAVTPDGKGYWLVASDGGIFTFGDAGFYGSTGAEKLSKPIVGMATTADGRGYWLVASDGGVFTFGDAVFHGAGSSLGLSSPVVGIAADTETGGYWEATAAGAVLGFGAPGFGAAPALSASVVGLVASADDGGVRLVGSDGNVYAMGDATNLGSLKGTKLTKPVVGITETYDGHGYWLVASDGGVFSFGDARFLGSAGAIRLTRPVVGVTG